MLGSRVRGDKGRVMWLQSRDMALRSLAMTFFAKATRHCSQPKTLHMSSSLNP